MNSAHGSCRLRSWAVPVLGTGDAGFGIPVVAFPEMLPEGGTIYAGPTHRWVRIKRSRCIDGDSLP
jgi:hypothetical protein